MKLTHQVKVIDRGMGAIKKRFDALRAREAYVKAGVMGASARNDGSQLTNAQLASIHEFGLGHVPARPWIRPPFMAKKEEYLGILRDAYARAIRSNNAAEFDRVLALLGQRMAADIKNYVTSGASPLETLAQATIDRKGSSRPLVDTGQLVNSVTSMVVKGKRK